MAALGAADFRLHEQQRTEMMAAIAAALERGGEDAEAVRNCQIVTTMWCDPSRQNDTALGGFGCWGDNITDVRGEYRYFRRNADGTTSGHTKWNLCQVLQISSNTADSRAVMDAKHFKLIAADDDGTNARRVDLQELTGKLRTHFPSEGFIDPRVRVDRVAVALRMSYVPVPDPADGWETEVRYVAYGYNTSSADDPTNLLLFGDTMNTSVFAEEPGSKVGFQPLYTKVLSGVGADADDREVKLRCYATSLESTDRSLADMGKESAAESRAMAAAGKGTAVRTGPSTLQASSACGWHVAIPLEKKAPPPPPPPPGLDALGRPLGPNGDCIYRSLGSANLADDIDDAEPEPEPAVRSVGGKPDKVAGKEGRIGIGTYVEDAKPIPIKTPVCKNTPAVATGMFFMTVPWGKCPDDETVVESCRKLKAFYKSACELGEGVDDRLSDEAVKQGLTKVGPVSKKAKTEIAECIGAEKANATMPGTEPVAPAVVAPPVVAPGRPLLAGVPRD